MVLGGGGLLLSGGFGAGIGTVNGTVWSVCGDATTVLSAVGCQCLLLC